MKVFRLNKAAALIVVLTSSSAAVGALTAGTYETTGKGNNGPVVVQTTIENSQIKDIKVLKNSATPMIG